MRKKNLLFGIVLGMLFISATHSSAAYIETGEVQNARTIPLEGDRPSNDRLRSIIAPIIVEQQGSMLFAYFQMVSGTVQVTITDEWGVNVFTETVNVSMQPSLVISLMGLPAGNYVITFSGVNLKLRGEFEL